MSAVLTSAAPTSIPADSQREINPLADALIAELEKSSKPEAPKSPEKPQEPPKVEADPTLETEAQDNDSDDILLDIKKEEKKVEEPKVDAKPSTKNAENIKALREKAQKAEALEQELTKIKTDYETFKKNPNSEEVTALRSQLDEYKKVVQSVALERDPLFHRDFTGKIAKAVEDAKALATDAGQDPEELASILLMSPGKERNDKLGDYVQQLNDADKSQIGGIFAEIRRINKDKQEALKNSEETAKRYQFEHKEAARMQQEAQGKVFNDVLGKKIAEFGPLRKVDGNDAHNQRADQLLGLARDIFSGNVGSLDDVAEGCLWAASGPIYKAIAIKQKERADKLEARVKQLTEGAPSVGGNKPSSAPTPNTKLDYIDAVIQGAGIS